MPVKEKNEKSNFSNFNIDSKTIEYVSVEVAELDLRSSALASTLEKIGKGR